MKRSSILCLTLVLGVTVLVIRTRAVPTKFTHWMWNCLRFGEPSTTQNRSSISRMIVVVDRRCRMLNCAT